MKNPSVLDVLKGRKNIPRNVDYPTLQITIKRYLIHAIQAMFTSFFHHWKPPFGMNVTEILYSLCVLGMLCSSCSSHSSASTQESFDQSSLPLPKSPILRLETGMHTQRISQIDVDEDNRFVVTASDDRTVRVWDLGTGQLLKILRPPIGDDKEGQIYAVAISPDAKTVACAGWTGKSKDGGFSIYLFDRVNGQIIRKISGVDSAGVETELMSPVARLKFSKDGRILAATLHGPIGKNGVRFFRTQDFRLIAKPANYGAESYGIDFDHRRRIVTSSFDGIIRLYGHDFQIIAETKALGGKRPVQVSFSPNGEKIAVGFDDSLQVHVLSGKDLSFLYAPETPKISNNKANFNSVVWSEDGEFLFAAGAYVNKQGMHPIRKWSKGGRGQHQDIPAARNTILSLSRLKDGGLAFGTAEPSLGRIDMDNNPVFSTKATLADFRDNQQGLLLSADGSTVQFSLARLGKQPVQFSIDTRIFSSSLSTDRTLFPPIQEDPGLNFTQSDWLNSLEPHLHGKRLPFDVSEISHSIAISHDHQSILFGTNWKLRLFDRNAVEIWSKDVNDAVWGVNISRDGRIALAAMGDGTIRWFRLKDGKGLLSFFPHPDGKRWVLWTPHGYYTSSSIDAEDYLGWHLNQGPNQAAQWYPVSQFRELRDVEMVNAVTASKRPDVEVLQQTEAALAAQRVHHMATKPLVRILSPKAQAPIGPTTEAPIIDVLIEAEDRGEGVQEILLQHNGGLVGFLPRAKDVALRPHVRAGQTHVKRFQVRLVDGVNVFEAKAVSRKGTESDPAQIAIQCRCVATVQEPTLPTLHVVTAGITNYQKISSLSFPQKDAEALAEVFQGTAPSRLFSRTVIYPLFNKQATKANLLAHFQSIKEIHPQDVLVMFLAGHGIASQDEWYFAPYDFDPDQSLADAGLAGAEIKKLVASQMAQGVRKILLLIDSCHSGQLTKAFLPGLAPDQRRPAPEEVNFQAWNQLKKVTGIHVIAASTSEQKAFEVEGLGHGVYARALLNGLEGDADIARDGEISVLELLNYVTFAVPQLMSGIQDSLAEKIQPTDRSSTLGGSPSVSLPLLSQEEQELLEQLNLGQTPVASIQGKNFSLVLANEK